MASMLELALRYARQGIRVAPMRPENKRPFTEHGIKDATTDEDLIRFWWRKWPYAWPGLAMGGEAGVFTLDVDVKNGVDGWATLTALGVIIEQSTPRIRTPSGGTHLIFKQPPFPISNSAGKLGPGLDIRSTGGYIIAAGSETAEGVRYEFMVGSYLDAPEAPAKLLELLKPPPRKEPPAWEPRARARADTAAQAWAQAALDGEIATIRSAVKTTRNTTLNVSSMKVAQVVAGGYLHEGMVRGELFRAALSIGLDEIESEKTIDSGFKKGFTEPRHPPERTDNGVNYSQASPGSEQTSGAGFGRDPDSERSEPELEPLPSIFASSWHDQPRPVRRFLDGRKLLPVGYVTIVTGDGGVGKTLLMLQASVAMTAATGWLGSSIDQAKVLFFSAEETLREIHTRVAEICEAEYVALDGLGERFELVDLATVMQPALFVTDRNGMVTATQFFAQLRLRLLMSRPKLLVIDNRGQAVIGNENDRGVATQVIRQLQVLAEELDMAIVLLAHPSQAGITTGTGASGSTAWFNTARSVLFLALEGDDSNLRKLTVRKANYSDRETEILLKWEYGRYICLTPPPGPEANIGRSDKAERVFKLLLTRNIGRGLATSAAPRSPNFAPKVFSALPSKERESVSYGEFRNALESLLAKGDIEILPYDNQSRRTSEIRFNQR